LDDRLIMSAVPASTVAAGGLVAGLFAAEAAMGADTSIDAAEVAGTRAPKRTMDRPSEASALRRARFWLNRLLPTRTSQARDGDGLSRLRAGRDGCAGWRTTADCSEEGILGCRFPCWGLPDGPQDS